MSLILVLLFFLHSSLLSSSNEELHYVNEVLTPGSPWTSPGEEFAFGFYPDSKSSELIVAIWFNKVENAAANNKTVVWTAGGVQPLLVKRSQVQLKLTSNGFVVDGYWTGPSNVSGVASASLTQYGNLILFDSSYNQLWQSFSSPTDTILPNQQVNVTKTAVLTSQSYTFTVSSTQVALLHALYAAWNYWVYEFKNNDTGIMLSFTPQGQVMLTAGAGDKLLWSIYPLDFGEVVPRRFHLSSDGNLRILSLHANTTWKIVWQSVLNECEIHGVCGGFGLCTFRPTKVCSCPPGFSMRDVHDETRGCTYNVPVPISSLCSEPTDHNIRFVKVVSADYFYNDIQAPLGGVTVDECENVCRPDCQCLAYLYKYDGNALCYLKGAPMYNGRQTYLDGNILFLKLSANDTSATDQVVDLFISNTNSSLVLDYWQGKIKEGYLQKRLGTILLAVSISEVLLAVGVAILTFVCWKRNTRKLWEELTAEVEGAPTRYTYKQLQAATTNFEEVLGSGAFGTVYKGEIPDKGGDVAVKVIHGATHAEKQFAAEVNTIGKIHHVNLVRLLGYCAEGDHKILVYEYMANGSLDTMLFDKVKSTRRFVDWETRLLISQGIAKGLAYLHEDCQDSILHCDIKPQNVLMDVNMCPKIADFGLAKLVKKDHELTVTTVGGTRGYLAPEWLNNQPVTTKADVYSFGMLLFDLLSGREIFKLTPSAIDADEWYFPAWAFNRYAEKDLSSIADPKLESTNVDWKQFEMILKVAFWCTQFESSVRPSMSKVAQMVDRNVQVPEPPFPQFDVDEPYIENTYN